MLSICDVDVDDVGVAVSWNSFVRCINEDDFDVWMTDDDDVEKAEQLLLSADRNREIARVLLVFMIDEYGCRTDSDDIVCIAFDCILLFGWCGEWMGTESTSSEVQDEWAER